MSGSSTLLTRLLAVERQVSGGPQDPGLLGRVDRLERDVHDIRTTLTRMEPLIVRIDAELGHLATKVELAAMRAELAAKPTHAYLWGILAALLAAYGSGLAALAVLK